MKLVAVSDTHGDHKILEAILTQQPDADAYLYAGDSEFAADDPIFSHYQAVRGNMDFDSAFPLTRTLTVGDVTVFLAHGHRLMVGFSLSMLLEAAQQAGAQVAIFGHTHALGVEMHQGILTLNPGSISQPRGEFAALGGTYAVIESTAARFRVTYYLRSGRPAPGLARTFTR